MAQVLFSDNQVVIKDPERPVTKFIVVDHDMTIFRYSVKELKEYYQNEDMEDTFSEIAEALREEGFYKRYDDEAGVTVFATDEFDAFIEQLNQLV